MNNNSNMLHGIKKRLKQPFFYALLFFGGRRFNNCRDAFFIQTHDFILVVRDENFRIAIAAKIFASADFAKKLITALWAFHIHHLLYCYNYTQKNTFVKFFLSLMGPTPSP
jgi:hypothetical protein